MVGDISFQHRTDKNGATRIFCIAECRSVNPQGHGTGSALLDKLWVERKNVRNDISWFGTRYRIIPNEWLSEMQPNESVPFYTKHAGYWFSEYDYDHLDWPTDDLGDEVDYVIPKIINN